MTLLYVAARESAEQLLKELWDGSLPVRLNAFSQALGVTKYESILSAGLSGVVNKSPGQDPVVVLNNSDTPQRRRFTWAHELGHVVERRDIAGDGEYSFIDARKVGNYDLHEFFADEFAGALLMPSSEIQRMKAEGWSAAEMARAFDVSVAAVEKRLERLERQPDEAPAV